MLAEKLAQDVAIAAGQKLTGKTAGKGLGILATGLGAAALAGIGAHGLTKSINKATNAINSKIAPNTQKNKKKGK